MKVEPGYAPVMHLVAGLILLSKQLLAARKRVLESHASVNSDAVNEHLPFVT